MRLWIDVPPDDVEAGNGSEEVLESRENGENWRRISQDGHMVEM